MELNAASTTELITNSINSIISSLFSSIDNNIYSVLDDITFINSDIIKNSYFEKILGTNLSSGFLLICNSLVIGFVLYYAVSLIFSYLTFSSVQSPMQFIFKIIIFTVIMNFSYFICEQIITFNSNISLAIRQIGENLFSKNICFSSLISELNSSIYYNSDINLFSLDGLMKSFVSLGFFNLIFSYSLRYFLIKLFILICPFAILSLSLQKTSWFFYAWVKSFFSLLFVQLLISIILVLIFSLDFSNNDLFSKLICIGSIYALIKANNIVKEFIGGLTTNMSLNLMNLKNSF